MKIFFVLLLSLSAVLCSSNYDIVQPEEEFTNYIIQPESFTIIDGIYKLIEKFIQSIKDKFNSLLEKLQEEIARIYAKIVIIIEKARSKLKIVVFKAEVLIRTLKDKGGAYKECAEKYEKELNELKNTTNEHINQCSDKYVQTIKDYEEGVRDSITEIQKQIEELRVAVVTCGYLNPFKTVKCLVNRLSEYKTKIEGILFEVVLAVRNAADEGIRTITSVKKCTQNALGDAIVEVEEIQIELNGCFALTTTSTTTTTTTSTTTTTTKNPDTTTTAATTTTTTTEAPTTKANELI